MDIGETSQERVTSAVEGLLLHAYLELAMGQDDRDAGFKLLAGKFMTAIVQDGLQIGNGPDCRLSTI